MLFVIYFQIKFKEQLTSVVGNLGASECSEKLKLAQYFNHGYLKAMSKNL